MIKKCRRTLLMAVLIAGLTTSVGLFVARGDYPGDIEDDATFLRKAYLNCLWKIESGKLAAKQTETTDVKNFAVRVVSHCSALVNEMNRLMKNKGVDPQGDFNSVQKNTLTYMSTQRGATIDREYMSMVADDLSADLKRFQRAARYAKDPDIRAFADRAVKGLKEDFVLAERTMRNLPPPVLK
jgi:putative membrane protein